MKTELARWLEDEIDAIAGRMGAWEAEAREFWSCPGQPALSIWCAWPADEPVVPPPWPGAVTEVELYYWLQRHGKTSCESRQHGFSTVPIVYPHDKHYRGPAFRTRFLPVVMGAQVRYPAGVDGEEQDGWLANVDPLIGSVEELDRLREVDVSQSPALQAVLKGYDEINRIVRGRVCCMHYAPTGPLDMAADLVGHCAFYELLAAEPEKAASLIEVCTEKWVEIVAAQEARVNGRWARSYYERGISCSDMILRFISPVQVRSVVIPYNALLGELYGGVHVDIDHSDAGLLRDYLGIPSLSGIGVPETWDADLLVREVGGRCVLKISLDWHYHEGRKIGSPVCKPWSACLEFFSRIAGRMRVLVTLSGWGDSSLERRNCICRDRDDLMAAWQRGAS